VPWISSDGERTEGLHVVHICYNTGGCGGHEIIANAISSKYKHDVGHPNFYRFFI